MGHALMAGGQAEILEANAENEVPSPQIFHYNHWWILL